jgi:four helix bundle protein
MKKYGLLGQIRRAVISIRSNIAEGAARQTKKNFKLSPYRPGVAERIGHAIRADQTTGLPGRRKLHGFGRAEIERIDKMISGLIRHLAKS